MSLQPNFNFSEWSEILSSFKAVPSLSFPLMPTMQNQIKASLKEPIFNAGLRDFPETMFKTVEIAIL
jgi:hypothetical protein